ncbi:hypothetical protein ABFP37_16640 [Burkholderia sp. RS01]|uniref:hypothetical protein n=1 Tax=unclassified Burkholderia TaxID=2613784 RepID=UPI003218C882
MAEHNGGNRGGNDRGYSGSNRGSQGGPFRGTNNSGGDPRGFRAKDGRGSDGPRRAPGGDDRKPFADRPRREGDGDRRGFDGGEKNPFADRDRKPFGDRPRREGDGERRSFGAGERKPFGDRPRGERDGERKPFGDRPRRDGEGERKPFGDRDRKPFGDRPRRDGEGERKPFGDRDRKPFGDRPRGERDGERRSFGAGERKPFGDRDRKPFGDRPRREGEGDRRRDGEGERRSFGGGENRKPFGDRQDRAPRSFDRNDSGPRQFGRDRAEDRPVRVPNARDLRSANRPDRERSPQIDEDVTGKELDRATQHQIKTLEAKSAEWVARHLVMAGRLIDDEPELAFQHALAASRRGGRLSAVREAVGLTAYAAGHYGEALREFRTYRRISGSNVHLPVMADCERGLGRPDRALDVVRSEEAQDLDAPGKVELAIVASGARSDLGQLDAAVAELEIPQLDINRAFSYSPRLFRAYADALAAVGRGAESEKWLRQAAVAEEALGMGVSEEPDIIDLGWDEEEEAREEAERKRLMAHAATDAAPQEARTSEHATGIAPAAETAPEQPEAASADDNLDDVESDYFESDDAESDADSAEPDEDEDGDGEASAKDTRHEGQED